jgi:hypothetical protein
VSEACRCKARRAYCSVNRCHTKGGSMEHSLVLKAKRFCRKAASSLDRSHRVGSLKTQDGISYAVPEHAPLISLRRPSTILLPGARNDSLPFLSAGGVSCGPRRFAYRSCEFDARPPHIRKHKNCRVLDVKIIGPAPAAAPANRVLLLEVYTVRLTLEPNRIPDPLSIDHV